MLWRSETKTEDHPDGIPIVPIPAVSFTFDVDGRHYTRTQLPLRLAWAVTIHKPQGLTLNIMKIGLGKIDFCVGLTFVVLSRRTSVDSIMFVEAFNYSRVQKLGGCALDEHRLDFFRPYNNASTTVGNL